MLISFWWIKPGKPRGSHLYMSRVEDLKNQNWIEQSKPFLRTDQGLKVTSKLQIKFVFDPYENQAIKHTFCGSKILIPITNASTGDIQVTTPCKLHLSFCISHLIYIWVGSHSYGCQIYSTTAIKSGHVIDCKEIRIVEVAGIKGSRHYAKR